jgi:hypothetical protein
LTELEARLAWILGSPRTGSTWLLHLLTFPLELTTDTPSGSALPEWARTKPAAVPINEPHIAQHLTPLLPPYKEPGVQGFPLNVMRADDPNYFFATAFESAWRPELRRLILMRLEAQAALAEREQELRDPLVVVKEPNGPHGAEFLMSLLPRSKFIFQLRDGRDVVDSLLHAQLEGGWQIGALNTPISGASERLGFVRRHSHAWVNATEAVQRAYGRHPPELRITIRYEDLRADTLRTLRELVDWLGMERSEEELGAAVAAYDFESLPAEAKGPEKALRVATPGAWRENLAPEEHEAMAEIMAPKLVELGYDA